MSEKPLMIQVAEAIGWRDVSYQGGIMLAGRGWYGWPPATLPIVGEPRPFKEVPNYADDWSATGPLLEAYQLDVFCLPPGSLLEPPTSGDAWYARAFGCPEPGKPFDPIKATGPTPLVAVCNLILMLAAQVNLCAR